MVKMVGFGLSIAVLFDAFVVRMTVGPAVLALDVDGEGLIEHFDGSTAEVRRGA
ncbi:hypothetical protein ACWD4O_44140 [Streptomyces sp. NPDC002623]